MVLPLGITNAPGTFTDLMNKLLVSELYKFVNAYLDDVLIHSDIFDDHL